MKPITVLVLLSVAALVAAQDVTTNNLSERINSIESKSSVRLDPYIRKALLKALSELEESDYHSTTTDITEGTSTVDAELLRTGEDVTETLPAAKEGIQIHSFVVNGQAAFANNSNTTPTFIDSKYSIISTTAGNLENHVTSTLPTMSPFNEIFQTKETGVNLQQVRSIQGTSKSGIDNTITNTKPVSTTTTTTTTTTSTTPKPTHNDDGENIEEVDKRDVQVFQAPLVAAFTVHQDAQGLPKKVVPLYQQTNIQNAKPLASVSVPTALLPPQSTPQANRVSTQTDFISQQLALQKQLEEKQKILEEQLRLLQIQQRQQEELLRKQQFLLQQKEAQRLQQINFEQDQLKRQQFISEQQRPPINQPNNFQKNVAVASFPNNGIRSQNAQVSIQQSLPLEQNNLLPHQQQLPNREAVDFLLHLRNQQSEQFPLQDNHIPQGIASFLQPNPIPPFNQPLNFNQLRAEDQFRAKQANRVFRQESGVGNFGVNNQNFNRYNNGFNPIFPNRFPLNRQNQYNSDVELKQLLAQNGLNARGQEDLNIVSKVLSLNHGIPLNNNINNNRLPFDSRRHVRP